MRAENALRWVAFGCAIFLVFAMVMPDWLARTSWSRETRNSGTLIFDSPAGYVGLVSLCGIVAFVALAVGLWRWRWAVATALAASAAFAYGAYAAGDYWLGLTRGVALLDGHARMGSKWTIHRPDALPVFFVAALIGAVASFALAVSWPRQAHGDHAG